MDNRNSIHINIVAITTLASGALTAKSILSGWEVWMAPVLILGILIMWILHVFQISSPGNREYYYAGFAMLGAFYYSVHPGSIFDSVVIMSIVLVTMSMLDNMYIMNMILMLYLMVMVMQVTIISDFQRVVIGQGNLGRLFFHVTAMLILYYICFRKINERKELDEEIQMRDRIIEEADGDNEDFLTNISHELRTPVNVVNGMTTLILKKEDREDIWAINGAGLRLSRQIEDIQDYTEIRRKQLILEEDRYMMTSLINDVISSLRIKEGETNLEFIVDLEPSVPSVMLGDIRKLHKIIRHLMDNAMKFTKKGGVYVRLSAERRDYGVNFLIEVTDTGIGMSKKAIENASKGLYQANKKRNRSTGGIGLGLKVVYGFAHKMGGFVKIKSRRGQGTTVRVSIPQKVVDSTPCLSLDKQKTSVGTVLFHVDPGKYEVPRVREFYHELAVSIASGVGITLYSAANIREVRAAVKEMEVTHIFMGEEEYEAEPEYFDGLAKDGITVAVSATSAFKTRAGSSVIVMPKPLYGYPVMKVLNGISSTYVTSEEDAGGRPILDGVTALIVDDEPMNLIVATGLFKDYNMLTDTAGGGKEAIAKFEKQDYDVIFMDHMMPEMDGVETMKRMRQIAMTSGSRAVFVALTTNAVSGAKEMFLREGFDGFISKPIDVADFERVMKRVIAEPEADGNGGAA